MWVQLAIQRTHEWHNHTPSFSVRISPSQFCEVWSYATITSTIGLYLQHSPLYQ
jgi:hypothetical protein